MRSPRLAVLVASLSVLGVVLLLPGAASAATYTTTLTCTSATACGTPSTTPTPPTGVGVTAELLSGSAQAEAFRVVPVGGAAVTSVVAALSTGGTAAPVASSENIYFFTISSNFISSLTVTWNDDAVTTTSSTSSTSTSSTSSTSTSSTTSTSTTTTTTLPPTGPGFGPQSIRPDAVDQSSPDTAAVRGSERVDVVVRNSDNNIQWSFETPGNPFTAYSSLGSPPGGAAGNPALSSWGPGRLDVFVRGLSDNRLWQNFSNDGGASWFGWVKPFGDDGTLTASPELASRGQFRLNVFVTNTDGDVYEHFYDGPEVGGGGWSSNWMYHGKPAGGFSGSATERSDPGAAAWGNSERVDLFGRGADNQLWQKFYDGTGWTDWFKPVDGKQLGSGLLQSEPEITSPRPGFLYVFARGSDGGMYAIAMGTGGWAGGWVRLVRGTDTWQSGAGATSRGTYPSTDANGNAITVDRFDVFARGTDNVTYHIWQ